MSYFINNTDLESLGIYVSEFSGYSDIPARKGVTENDFAGYDGVTAVNDVINVDSRQLILKCYMITDTMQLALTNINSLRNLLYQQNSNLILRIDYLDQVFICYCKDGFKAKRNTANVNSSKIVHEFMIKLIELNPTLVLTYGQAVDGAPNNLQDGNGDNFIIW